ncbi:MAG TPA: GNAT family N-acetyltransferase [Candidatus Anaerobiospirillum pullistercoris]|uniref:GNAT family N-acetyltransferase n=1 Tax=Candidatus Anaerobiospirillum pullistercoris TaxID=2838452 RepID=A0A9D1WFJ5_9GAMM|nr:GNAT family N-acetyltransferase [Candidatus Anaerobiospirillum pullistercoris]
MEWHHMTHSFKLWSLNHKLARRIHRKKESQTFGDYTFVVGSARYLKDIQGLHFHLFRQPMLNWLIWLYRFSSENLVSLALDKDGKVVGYECFMFNEVEIQDRILHEVYVGVTDEHQGKGVATALRKFSINSYDFGNLKGLSTVALNNDIKALRSAQKAGYGITKQSLKPPGQYLFKALTEER